MDLLWASAVVDTTIQPLSSHPSNFSDLAIESQSHLAWLQHLATQQMLYCCRPLTKCVIYTALSQSLTAHHVSSTTMHCTIWFQPTPTHQVYRKLRHASKNEFNSENSWSILAPLVGNSWPVIQLLGKYNLWNTTQFVCIDAQILWQMLMIINFNFGRN